MLKHHRHLSTLVGLLSLGLATVALAVRPTMTSVSTLTGATEDTQFEISWSDLDSQGNAVDVDGDAIQFRFQSVQSGVLRDGGGVAVAANALLSSGESWFWTPAQDDNGVIDAFRIRAYAGGQESNDGDVQVSVDVAAVNDKPVLTSIGTFTGGLEDAKTTIPFADLFALVNATDPDGDTLQLRLKSVSSGTLDLNIIGTPAPVGSVFGTGDTWYWTPGSDANGTLAAFKVSVYDGTVESDEIGTVNISITPVNDEPFFVLDPAIIVAGGVSVDEDAGAQTIQLTTVVNEGATNESAQGLTFEIDPTYDTSLFTTTGKPLISDTGVLTFTPALNENGTTQLTIRLKDDGGTANGGDDTSPDQTLDITIDPVPDDPEIAGPIGKDGVTGATEGNPIPDRASAGNGGIDSPLGDDFAIFNNLTVTDPDHDKPAPDLLDLVVTIPEVGDEYGTFEFAGWSSSTGGGNTTYTLLDQTPTNAQSKLRAVIFTPTANAKPVDVYSFGITIQVTDSTARSDLRSNEPLWVESVNDPPQVTASLSPTTISDSGSYTPFRLSVFDADPDDTFSVTITETAPLRGNLTVASSPITGDAAAVAAGVAAATYQPFSQVSIVNATFTFGVTDIHPSGTPSDPAPAVTDTAVLEITYNNDAPQLSGIQTEVIRITDDPGADDTFPFSTAVISDADSGQQLTVTILIDDNAKGALGGGVFDASTTNQITGTASEVTERLRQVTFTPTYGRPRPPDGTETVILTVRVSDGVDTLVNNGTQILVTSVDGAPAVLWDKTGPEGGLIFPTSGDPTTVTPFDYSYVTPEETTDVLAANPFELVDIEDNGEIVVTISIDDPAKGFIDPATLGGFTETVEGSGVYTMTGDPATITADLQAFVYIPDADYLFPPGEPGRTDFEIIAADAALNTTIRVLPIVLINDSRNFLITSVLDDPSVAGTLRHALVYAKDNDVITFALPNYPAVIRFSAIEGTMVLDRHLTLLGPGINLLTISGDANGNGNTDSGDLQLMRVLATVKMKGIRFSRGFAGTGGAISVERSSPDSRPGELIIEDCAFSNCLASQWGGAIDVDEGRLDARRCVFENNSLNVSSGLGGGAVSIYTDEDCVIENSTFSGNSQGAFTGFGGGALYVENFTASTLMRTEVRHCTFAENVDASNGGSSIRSNVSNTRVELANDIFADESEHNLKVVGSSAMVSDGGNLSTDNTAATLIQGGVPQNVFILDDVTDQRMVDPRLAPIRGIERATRGYRLLGGSPALGSAIPELSLVDQTGALRDGTPDSGAVDSTLGRVIIHEISPSEADATEEFIEFFNPRDQAALDISGFQVRINGAIRHTFASPLVIQPGFGAILVAPGSPVTPANSDTPRLVATNPNKDGELGIPKRGLIELLKPDLSGELRVIESVAYNTAFVDKDDPTGEPTTDFDEHSITLAPQSQGAAFVPNGTIKSGVNGGVDLTVDGSTGETIGDPTSPGADATGTPFGSPNAYPNAVANAFEINEDDLAILDVLANDSDADGSDRLFIVDLDEALTDPGPPTGSAESLFDGSGNLLVQITPGGTDPLRGELLQYDPRLTYNRLPSGARVTDTFAYSIIDVGGGAVLGYSSGAGTTEVSAPSHRLGDPSDTAMVTISGCSVAAYNGSHTATVIDEDTFSIPVTFSSNAATPGEWLADAERSPTERSEALVSVTILGRNDPPQPGDDLLATNEDTVLRIFGDRQSGDSVPALDTDVLYAQPRDVAPTGILRDDTDPDTVDQPFTQLQLVGVCQATDITDFAGTIGASPVVVTSPGHGLADGETILISSYEGHPSYNNYHVVSDVTTDTFSIPVTFVDNVDPADLSEPKARWARLDDTNRFQTVSLLGADVLLEIRANRNNTNIVYNARSSAELNALADGESANDSFFYAVRDTSGAVSLARIGISVDGINDAPVPTDGPPGIDGLLAFAGGGSLTDAAGASTVLYLLPSDNGSGRVDVTVRPSGAAASEFAVLSGMDWTHEDMVLEIPSARLLGDDGEVDTTDELSLVIGTGEESSLLGAALSLSGDPAVLTYDPTGAPQLQALAFRERVLDLITIGVTDGIATVPTTFVVVVEGRNDSPVASPVFYTTDERSLITDLSPGLIENAVEIDRDTHLPDNRKFLLPAEDLETTVFGARVDYLLEDRQGPISGFGEVPGDAGSTLVNAVGHGLATGEDVVLPASGDLTGQYRVTVVDPDSFTIEVPWDAAYSGLTGTWRVLASTFLYDPRASVFAGPTGDPSFTLQGLAEGQSYIDTFNYTVLDGSHLFANDDIYRIEFDRTDIQLNVLDNDTRLDGVTTSHSIISVGPTSAGGTVSIEGGSSLIYTPETGFVGDEHFTYTIEDNLGFRATALVTARVTIDRLNGNLRANADDFTVAAGEAPLLNVLANDNLIPATGDPLELVEITVAPSQGGTAVIEGGQIRYTPAISGGTETFTYRMSGGGTATAEAVVSILVVDLSNSLNVRDDSFGVPSSSSGITLNVLENDNVLPGTGEALEIVEVTEVESVPGVVEIVAGGTALTYTPPAGFLGTDTFTYRVSDGFGGGGTALVTVEVGYLTTNTDIFGVPFDDSGLTSDDGVTDLDVLANDNVLQGGSGGLEIIGVVAVDPVAAATLGVMDKAADNLSLEFDPAEDEVGQADFIYTVEDASGRTANGLVTVVVISSGVRASSDYFTVQSDSSANQLNLLSNDLPLGTLAISSIGTGPDAPDQGGTVEISGDFTSVVYTPAPGFVGTESFTYLVTDGVDSDTARVTVEVTAGAMVAADDEFLVYLGSEDNRLSVLLNDRVIPDAGQLLTITAIGLDEENLGNPASRGTLEIIESGSALRYTPSPDNPGPSYTETFTYEISAGGTDRAEGRISIEVRDRGGVRDLETNDDSFAVGADSPGTALPVLANDSVLPASAGDWVITSVSPPVANVCSAFLFVNSDILDPTGLAATIEGQGDALASFLWAQFSPAGQAVLADPGSSESDLVQTITDEFNGLIQGGASIYDSTRFGGIPLRPETQSLIDQGATGDQIVVLNRLLLEDAYPTELNRAPGGGTLQIAGTTLLYTPEPGFVGSVRFFYHVSDGLGGTGFAEVVVRIGDISVSEDHYTVLAGGGPVDLDVTGNDGILRIAFPSTPDPAQADFVLSTEKPVDIVPAGAGLAGVVDGVVRFTPDSLFTGIAELTYWVVDDGGCTYPGKAHVDVRSPLDDESTAQVSVTVTGVNDAPMLLGADPSGIDDTMQGNPFANATVIEWDEQRQQIVTITINFDPIRGTLVGDFTEISPGVLQFIGTAEQITAALRALVFTPTINRIPVGTTEDSVFSVSMDDGFVATPVVVDTAVVTVTPVNDLPVITGTAAAQNLYQYSSFYPFSGVDITDVDDLGLQLQTVTVQIDDPIKGVLTNLGGFVEQPAGSGIYIFVGTPAAAGSAIRGLLFTPTPGDRVTPGNPEIAGFTVSVDDGFAPPVVDPATSVVVLHGQVDRLLPLDGGGTDQSQNGSDFGVAVAISGDTLAVGSSLRDGTTANEGRVFIYERDSGTGLPWGQVAELSASDRSAGDQFGEAVAIDGDVLVVGAPGEDASGSNTGAVYIFNRSPIDPDVWTEVAKLPPPAVSSGDGFGSAVAIDGDMLVVGSPYSSLTGAPRSGRAFVFRLVTGTWTHEQTLITADNRVNSGDFTDSERFGAALDIEGDTIVIGAPRANRSAASNERDYGAAYIFTRPTSTDPFAETLRLDEFTDPDGTTYSGFGYSVDLSGDRLAIGIYSGGSPIGNFKAGRARIHERNQDGPGLWGLVQKFTPVSGLQSTYFGHAVAISGDLLMIGSPGPDSGATEVKGMADVYRFDAGGSPAWGLIDRFAPGVPGVSDRYAHALAFDGFTAVAGAVDDGTNALSTPTAGCAYVYQFQYDLGPRQVMPFVDQLAVQDELFEFVVPEDAFGDPIYPGELVIGVELADGNPLPGDGWLAFDPLTRTFSGTPTAGERRDYSLVVYAVNPLGTRIDSNVFHVVVAASLPADLQAAYDAWVVTQFPPGVLSDPLLEGTVWGMNANPDGDAHSNVFDMLFGNSATVAEPYQIMFEKVGVSDGRLTFLIADVFPESAMRVEWSTDMQLWRQDSVAYSFNPAGLGVREVIALASPPGNPTKLFVRIVVGP